MDTQVVLFTAWCLMNVQLCKDYMKKEGPSMMYSTNSKTTPFMLKLYRKIAPSDQQTNAIISPISVTSLLGMLSAGAQGSTHDEITELLGWDNLNEVTTHNGMSGTVQQLNSYNRLNDTELTFSNAVFIQSGFKVLKQYQSALRDYYAVSNFRSVDFSQSYARDAINAYVAEKTNDLVSEAIPPNVIDSNTKLVLCNVLYFKSAWLNPFTELMTYNGHFKISNDRMVKTDLMYQTNLFNYGVVKKIGAQVIELKYSGVNMSMVVLLPELESYRADPKLALEAMKQKIVKNQDVIANVGDYLRHTRISLTLPKFQMTTTYNLKDYLPDLGVKEIFDPLKADLSGITGVHSGSSRNLYVSAILHKAHLIVDEKGSEGAAVTSGTTSSRSGGRFFRADRPFAFYILDKASKAVLFFGQLVDPTATELV